MDVAGGRVRAALAADQDAARGPARGAQRVPAGGERAPRREVRQARAGAVGAPRCAGASGEFCLLLHGVPDFTCNLPLLFCEKRK